MKIISGILVTFLSLSKSVRKASLHWMVVEKQIETRQKKINEVAIRAAQQNEIHSTQV